MPTLFLSLILVIALDQVVLAQGPPGPPMDRGPRLTEEQEIQAYLTLDKNADHTLTRDEVPARLQGLFARADQNHDDIITTAELADMVKKRFTALAKRVYERPGLPF